MYYDKNLSMPKKIWFSHKNYDSAVKERRQKIMNNSVCQEGQWEKTFNPIKREGNCLQVARLIFSPLRNCSNAAIKQITRRDMLISRKKGCCLYMVTILYSNILKSSLFEEVDWQLFKRKFQSHKFMMGMLVYMLAHSWIIEKRIFPLLSSVKELFILEGSTWLWMKAW